MHPSPEHPAGDPVGPGCYHQVLHEWFKETFPKVIDKVPVTLTRTVADQHGELGHRRHRQQLLCVLWGELLKRMYEADGQTHHLAKNADLIILEFDVNDQA